jgi:hypothetical protein
MYLYVCMYIHSICICICIYVCIYIYIYIILAYARIRKSECFQCARFEIENCSLNLNLHRCSHCPMHMYNFGQSMYALRPWPWPWLWPWPWPWPCTHTFLDKLTLDAQTGGQELALRTITTLNEDCRRIHDILCYTNTHIYIYIHICVCFRRTLAAKSSCKQ